MSTENSVFPFFLDLDHLEIQKTKPRSIFDCWVKFSGCIVDSEVIFFLCDLHSKIRVLAILNPLCGANTVFDGAGLAFCRLGCCAVDVFWKITHVEQR